MNLINISFFSLYIINYKVKLNSLINMEHRKESRGVINRKEDIENDSNESEEDMDEKALDSD